MDLWVTNLGVIDHGAANAIQEALRARRIAGEIPDTLLLLQHTPVYTRGRRRAEGELPMGEDWYRSQGIDIVDVDRGGHATYHGPGQLIGYAVMRTDDVVQFIRRMERALVAALADEGITARQRTADGPDYTGVWVADRKLASIGVHVQKGVTTHGFGVNVINDLQPFEWIVPCGLEGVRMTSIAREAPAGGTGEERLTRFAQRATARFADEHELRARVLDPAESRELLELDAPVSWSG